MAFAPRRMLLNVRKMQIYDHFLLYFAKFHFFVKPRMGLAPMVGEGQFAGQGRSGPEHLHSEMDLAFAVGS